MMRALLLLSVLGAAATAQVTVTATVPGTLTPAAVDRPFAGGIGRYQQWFSAASLQASIPEPRRITSVEFFAGPPLTSQAAQIDCELWLGHGQSFGVFGTFDTNWASPPVQVKARANVALAATTQGQVCMTFPLTTTFTWDRTRPLLMEIRVYGNSLSSQPFNYNFNGVTSALGTTSRVYGTVGGAAATSGTVQQGWGMVTRFTARQGVNLEFGTGCPGEGGFTPVGLVQNLAWPGITWNHTITNAPSQRSALWVIGDTKDTPFPLDLNVLLGLPASGCMLRMPPVNTLLVTTVGGGAGAGTGSLGVPLPAVTSYVGASLFTQWVVLDPLSPNGIWCVTPANWAIVAPVGG